MSQTRLASWLLALALGFGAAGAPNAQELSQFSSPVLTLDQERLFNESLIAARVVAGIESRSLDLAAENRRIEAELVAEELDLTERRPTLALADFRALADAFDAKVQTIREEQDAKALELQRQQDEIRQGFLNQITPVLAEIVRDRGAVVVLDRRSVFLSAESIDITDEAITRINAVFGDGTTPEPVPPGPEVTPANPEN